jgi:hypothetical protein
MMSAALAAAWAQVNPSVVFSPSPLKLTVEATATAKVSAVVVLKNTGNPFSFTSSSGQNWMTVAPATGTVATGESIQLTVACDPALVLVGAYTGLVTVTPAAASGYLPVSFEVDFTRAGVWIELNASKIEFSQAPDTVAMRTFNVAMSDKSAHVFTVTPTSNSGGDWLTVVADSVMKTPQTVTLRASTFGMQAGSQALATIEIASADLPGMSKTIQAMLSVTDQTAGLSVVPSLVQAFVYGSAEPPTQPIQVTASGGAQQTLSVVPSAGSTAVVPSSPVILTPAVLGVRVDPSLVVGLPRVDYLNFSLANGTQLVSVPVKQDLRPSTFYAIPQVADGGPSSGGKFRTSITVLNQDTATARVTLKFYKSDPSTRATTAWTPAMDSNATLENVDIPVGGAWTVQTAGTPESVSSGWAEIICSQKIGGLAVFRQLQADGGVQEAAVPINSTLMQRVQLPYDNQDGFTTSVAIANMSSTEAANVRVAFRNANGDVLKSDKGKDIPARGQYAFELPAQFSYLANSRGTADIWVLAGQVSVLGLRFSPGGAFTSFEPQSYNKKTSGRRTIPQVADGGDFRTSITLVNNDYSAAYVQLKFYKDSTTATGATTAWTVGFEGGVDPNNIAIPPASSITIRTTGVNPTVQSGWAEVVSDQWVTGFAVFRQTRSTTAFQEAAVPINVGATIRNVLPFDNTGGYTTSIAVANLSSELTSAPIFTFTDESGSRLLRVTFPTLPVRGHRAFRLIDLWPELDGRRGVLEIDALDGEVSTLGLRFASTGAFTSFKAAQLQ